MSLVLTRYVLMAAMRDRLLWSMLCMCILGGCLSIFSGSAAMMEQQQFVLTYMAGGLRIIFLFGLALFTVFFVRRSYDARDVEFLLTRPLSRLSFVLSQSAGFSILGLVAGLCLSGLVAAVALHYDHVQGLALWCAGVTMEFVIVMNVAFFFAMVLNSPVSAGLATFAFYILARLIGQMLAIIQHLPDVGIDNIGIITRVFGWVFQAISVVIPRFDLMAQTTWLLYGGGDVGDWLFILGQAVVFLSLVLCATYIDLKKRQF